MNEVTGDLWEFLGPKNWIIVPTNGMVNKDGNAVMGGGVALTAAIMFPDLPARLGARLKATGNYVYYFMDRRVVTFPTKNDWRDPSDLNLIVKSAVQIQNDIKVIRQQGNMDFHYYFPRIGCGLGGLEWHNVREAIRPYLSEPEITFVRNRLDEVKF